jgi:hypothetical protein
LPGEYPKRREAAFTTPRINALTSICHSSAGVQCLWKLWKLWKFREARQGSATG